MDAQTFTMSLIRLKHYTISAQGLPSRANHARFNFFDPDFNELGKIATETENGEYIVKLPSNRFVSSQLNDP